MIWIIIISFALGCSVGATLMVFILEGIWKNNTDEELQDMRERRKKLKKDFDNRENEYRHNEYKNKPWERSRED